jgi:soluble lytic murein transglycosylase
MNDQRSFSLRFLVMITLLGTTFFLPPFYAIAQDDGTSSDALADADQALLYGDYPTAIDQYNAALANPDLTCEALYGLGVTYLWAAQPTEADTTFTRYLNECETSFRVLVMRGRVRQQQDRFDEALADYQQAMAFNPGVLDSYLFEQMATLDPDQSVRYLRLATEAEREPEGKFALREHLADIYLLVGSPASALTQYSTLLTEIEAYLTDLNQVEGATFDQNAQLRARIELAAAELEIDMEQADAGYARLQKIITDYPDTSSALPALIILVLDNQPVDLLARMRINVANENYFPVVGVLTDDANEPDIPADAPVELYLLLGRAQRGLGDHDAALATFEQVSEQFPDDPAASVAALEQASTLVAMDDATQAVERFQAVATDYPQSPEAPEALLQAAQLERDEGDIEAALTLYDELGTQYPDSMQAQQGLFEAGMLLMNDDPTRAAALFGRVGSAQGFVWQGKVLSEEGNGEAAQQAWQQATAVDPGSFFAMRGCELLNEIEPFRASQTHEILPISEEDRTAAAQWVAQTFNLEGITADLSPELVAHPLLQRGTELWAVGWWDNARAEFDALHKLYRDDPAALLQLAFHYQTIPVYRSSVFAGTRLVFASELPLTQIPRAILQLAYPFYYQELFVDAAQQYTFDPLLVAALARQESSFDATNTSLADARGLMQLIPSTAQDVVNRLGFEDYTVDDLFRPVVNIPLDVYYMDFVRTLQDGSVPGTLLSYNAGAGAAQGWLTEAGGDLERLYEAITFRETKQYLELIDHNYTVYRYLYGDDMPGCMFEAVTTAASD